MAGRGDSIDGVAICYRLDSQIWTPVWDKRFLLSPNWTRPGAHPAVFTVDSGPLSWEYSIQDMQLITHCNLVMILRISGAIPLLLLCATIGMLWSEFYLLHMCGWLFMSSFFMYQQKRNEVNSKSLKSYEFTRKVCASSYPAVVTDI